MKPLEISGIRKQPLLLEKNWSEENWIKGKAAGVRPRWKIRILIKFVALLKSLAQSLLARKRFGRKIVNQYYLKQLQCSWLTQVYRSFWSQRMKDFQKSFKFQKREESDTVQDDREHWDGTETILGTGRSTNTHKPTEHHKNSNNCKNKLLTIKFKPESFIQPPSSLVPIIVHSLSRLHLHVKAF